MSDGMGHEASGEQPRSQGKRPRQGPTPLKSPRSLERLRDRVRKAAQELERLRKENAALTKRIKALETHSNVDFDGNTVVAFEEDPEVLREQVERFIQAIDAYLATEETD